MNKHVGLVRLLGAAAFLATNAVNAGGFALIEQGASGMGNAYAGAGAVSKDASTVWFNPAGMLELDGPEFVGALHLISVNSEFTNKGTSLSALFGADEVDPPAGSDGGIDAGSNSVVPNIYYVRPLNQNMSFGFGISVPFGNSTEYDEDWVGRYQAVESGVTVIDINPAFAYRINDKFNIGGGISVQFMDATLGNSIDSAAGCIGMAETNGFDRAQCAALPQLGNRADDSYAEITGDSTDVTFNLGMLYKPTPDIRLGAAYRHSIDHTLEGSGDFRTNPDLAAVVTANNLDWFQDTGATAIANLPPSLAMSGAYQLNDKIELLADATWTGWSSFEELRVTFDSEQPDTFNVQEYEDVWRLSAGLNFQQSAKLTLRTGVAYDEDPVPSPQLRTARIPGNHRTWIAFGAGYKISDKISFDVGYAHLFLDETPIDNQSSSAVGTTLRGVYDSNVNLLSAQFNWQLN